MRRILWLALLLSCLTSSSDLWSFQQPAPVGTTPPALAQTQQPTSSKIWVGRHAEFEEFLRTAEIERTTNVSVGVLGIRRGYFKAGGLAASAAVRNIKPGRYDGFWESYRSEVAAYKLDRLLGLDMVPPTVERLYKGEMVSVQLWSQNMTMLIDVKKQKLEHNLDDFEVRRQKVFQNLVGNLDPNQGNIMFDPLWNMVLIDFSRAFTDTRNLIFPPTIIDRPFFDRIKALDRATVKLEIGEFLEGRAVDSLFLRRDDIVKAFEKLAKDEGDGEVFQP